MGDASASLDPSNLEDKIYLNGEYVSPASGTKTYGLTNPKDSTPVVSSIPLTTSADIDTAVAHAERAFIEYSKFTALQRTECLFRLGQLMEESLVPILTLDSLTAGHPVSIIPTREKTYIKNCIMYYAGWCDKQKGDYLPADDGEYG